MKSSKLYIFALILIAFAAFSATAQDYNKFEVYGGYSYLSVDTGLDEFDPTAFDSRENLHGVNASVTGNFSKRFGLKFDFSTHSKDLFDDGFTDVKYRNNQFLGGVQFKNNEKDGPVLKPFGHVLAGVSNQRIECNGDCFAGDGLSTSINASQNNFAMAFGGGLDIKVHPRIDIRAFQIDYNPIFFRENGGDFTNFFTDSRTQNNFRIGVGIVIH
jgi:opacity protein-like surface antigen